MRLVEMICNHCGAELDLNLDRLQVYCPYCGNKLSIDFDGIADVFVEKEKTQRVKLKNEYSLEDKKMTYAHEQKEKSFNKKAVIALIIAVLLFNTVVWGYVARTRYLKLKAHNEQVAYLNELSLEIEDAIQNEDYDLALMMTNRLRLDDGWSEDEDFSWMMKRIGYQNYINVKIGR